MNHEQQVYLYWSDELEPEQRRRFELHLAGCDDCQQALADLGTVQGALGQLPRYRPTRDLLGAALEQTAVPRWRSRLAFSFSSYQLVPHFAALALALLVGIWWLSERLPQPTPASMVTAAQLDEKLAVLEQAVTALRGSTGSAPRERLSVNRQAATSMGGRLPRRASRLTEIRARWEAIRTDLPAMSSG